MRSRRALSTVVGAVFAIIALTSTVTYVSYSMGILDNYNQSVLTKNQQLSDVNKEKFQISSVTVPNGKLNITVTNTGSVPINFTKIWIQNQTAYSNGVDWVNSYVPTNSFVNPGGVLIKMGQKIPVTINSAYSYNVKLVTSRGNTQQFNINSANVAPLNIQLLSIPATVPNGFQTKLVMIVTNNGSNILTNVTPQTPTEVGNPTATCSLIQNQASPPSYNTLPPGSTAIFQWDLLVKGTVTGQTCKWIAQLQNGYNGNSASTTVTVTDISFTSTTLAQNSGILTLNYTTFHWSEGGGWKTGWAPTGGNGVAFYVNMTNNNQTLGSNFYLSKNSLLYTSPTSGGASSQPYYIMSNVTGTLGTTRYSCNGPPSDDYCIFMPPGGTVTLSFYATTSGSATQTASSKLPGAGTTLALNLIIFGKYASCQNCAGSMYGQHLPYTGIITQ